MKLEIDQSGKIEETAQPTVLAAINGGSRTIVLGGKTKRRLQEEFRKLGSPTVFVYNCFVVALFLLIEPTLGKCSEIVIDHEYPGKESSIAELLHLLFVEHHIENPPTIHFAYIGKSSQAHNLAIRTFRRQIRPDQIISFEKMRKEIFTKKNGRPVLKYQV